MERERKQSLLQISLIIQLEELNQKGMNPLILLAMG